ncbi:substrate-binding domain-containing protein [Halorussus litoreus]|uniref:substrate-binding domain-containing protein n=1 Tax=Halorussus litoreus TaxID=1710536 RepID=UPI000E22F740|nr:substrate-binding domain-containing protein [Halorussus litoreus]
MDRRRYVQLLGLGGAVSLAGCSDDAPGAERNESSTVGDGSQSASQTDSVADALTLATATTAHDSGLLGELTPGFEDRFDVRLKTIVRGTGGALRTARDGDCDVVLVHARPLEDPFLREGHGVNRRTVMVNDFLVVGPPDDPAGAAGRDPVESFAAIAESEATFLSRGDRSGTHIRERRLWDEAGVDPSGAWYRETGQGMGNTLTTAEQSGAYTLTDRGTFLTVSDGDALAVHVERGIDDPPPLLRNEYAVIPVNPARHDVAHSLALAYVGYLTGVGQSRIESFRVGGERAFRPLGASPEPDFQQYVPRDWRE